MINSDTTQNPTKISSVISFASSVISFSLGWVACATDYNTYESPDTPPSRIFLLTFLGVFLPAFSVQLVGFGCALAATKNDAYAAGLPQGVGGLIGAVLEPLGAFGHILMILLALSLVSNNVPMDYSMSLNMQGMYIHR